MEKEHNYNIIIHLLSHLPKVMDGDSLVSSFTILAFLSFPRRKMIEDVMSPLGEQDSEDTSIDSNSFTSCESSEINGEKIERNDEMIVRVLVCEKTKEPVCNGTVSSCSSCHCEEEQSTHCHRGREMDRPPLVSEMAYSVDARKLLISECAFNVSFNFCKVFFSSNDFFPFSTIILIKMDLLPFTYGLERIPPSLKMKTIPNDTIATYLLTCYHKQHLSRLSLDPVRAMEGPATAVFYINIIQFSSDWPQKGVMVTDSSDCPKEIVLPIRASKVERESLHITIRKVRDMRKFYKELLSIENRIVYNFGNEKSDKYFRVQECCLGLKGDETVASRDPVRKEETKEGGDFEILKLEKNLISEALNCLPDQVVWEERERDLGERKVVVKDIAMSTTKKRGDKTRDLRLNLATSKECLLSQFLPDESLSGDIFGVDLRKDYFLPVHEARPSVVYPVFNKFVHKLMCYEIFRIRSFEKCSQNIYATQLARNGFYHFGEDGEVMCFSCEIQSKVELHGTELQNAHEKNCLRVKTNKPVNQGTGNLTSSDFELFYSVYGQRDSWGEASGTGSSQPGGDFPQEPPQSHIHKAAMEVSGPSGENAVYFMVTSATKSPAEFKPYSKAWQSFDRSSEQQYGATGGHPESEAFLDLRGAAYPLFANRKARRDTFQSWDPNHYQKPEDLVNLGFFYAGYSDCARCFYCGLGLKYWRSNDNAAYQHARFRPQCLYNRFVKGQQYVDGVQRTIAAQSQNQTEGSGGNPATNGDVDVSNIGELMKTDAAKQVLEEGWTVQQVKQGITKLVQDLGEECLIYDILLEILTDIQRRQRASTAQQQTSHSTMRSGNDECDNNGSGTSTAASLVPGETGAGSRTKADVTESDGSSVVITTTTPSQTELSSEVVLRLLEREHSYLKKRLHCMVCGKNKVGCIYLPCAHVVACQACGDMATSCALCTKVISATAEAYLS